MLGNIIVVDLSYDRPFVPNYVDHWFAHGGWFCHGMQFKFGVQSGPVQPET